MSYAASETITPKLKALYGVKDYNESDFAAGKKFNPIYVTEDHDDDNDDIEAGQNFYYILQKSITITSRRATEFKGLIASTNDYILTYTGNESFINKNNGILSGIKMMPTNENNTTYSSINGNLYNKSKTNLIKYYYIGIRNTRCRLLCIRVIVNRNRAYIV